MVQNEKKVEVHMQTIFAVKQIEENRLAALNVELQSCQLNPDFPSLASLSIICFSVKLSIRKICINVHLALFNCLAENHDLMMDDYVFTVELFLHTLNSRLITTSTDKQY